METAKLRIVTDSPLPKIIAEAKLEEVAPRPINGVGPGPVSPPPARHLDVDDVLARSLPQVRAVNEIRRRSKVEPPTLSGTDSV